MTISQPAGNCRPSSTAGWPALLAPLAGLIARIGRWRERRRVAAELERLAAIGDYLLRDVGLDPGAVRRSQPAAPAQAVPRKRPIA
ncbi:MAG TPA: hypothetical protein VFS85_09930 [Dongiaceae bacterium]|jgi:uncharacterized protein YjiS (DUF1127 family)|nr:hypothetical protein [Dongiaceae bacterium]